MDAYKTEKEWLVGMWKRWTCQDFIPDSRFRNFVAPDLSPNEMAEATYESLDDLVEFVRPAPRGDNLLITNYDRRYEHGNDLVAVVRIVERQSYVPVEGGYRERVIVEEGHDRLVKAVERGLEFARRHNLKVQVNNRRIANDIEEGRIDISGLNVALPRQAGIEPEFPAPPAHYYIPGYEVFERVARRDGNSGMVQVPAKDIGKRFRVVRIDPDVERDE